MDKDKYIAQLSRYLPEGCSPSVVDFIIEHQVYLTISRPRLTKLGDYRSPHAGKGHRISVNSNLNQYSFLITLLHEFAHLLTWNRYKHKVKPHGTEWKSIFSNLLQEYSNYVVFPTAVKSALSSYIENPSASSCTDETLMRALMEFDPAKNTLENLPEGSVFSLPNGKVMRKGKKLRKYFMCTSLENNRMYRVHGLAEVNLVSSFSD